MAGRKVAVYAKCPYYRWEEGVKICCEGAIAGTKSNQIFATKQARIEHECRYCKKAWDKCPIAMLAGQKYIG